MIARAEWFSGRRETPESQDSYEREGLWVETSTDLHGESSTRETSSPDLSLKVLSPSFPVISQGQSIFGSPRYAQAEPQKKSEEPTESTKAVKDLASFSQRISRSAQSVLSFDPTIQASLNQVEPVLDFIINLLDDSATLASSRPVLHLPPISLKEVLQKLMDSPSMPKESEVPFWVHYNPDPLGLSEVATNNLAPSSLKDGDHWEQTKAQFEQLDQAETFRLKDLLQRIGNPDPSVYIPTLKEIASLMIADSDSPELQEVHAALTTVAAYVIQHPKINPQEVMALVVKLRCGEERFLVAVARYLQKRWNAFQLKWAQLIYGLRLYDESVLLSGEDGFLTGDLKYFPPPPLGTVEQINLHDLVVGQLAERKDGAELVHHLRQILNQQIQADLDQVETEWDGNLIHPNSEEEAADILRAVPTLSQNSEPPQERNPNDHLMNLPEKRFILKNYERQKADLEAQPALDRIRAHTFFSSEEWLTFRERITSLSLSTFGEEPNINIDKILRAFAYSLVLYVQGKISLENLRNYLGASHYLLTSIVIFPLAGVKPSQTDIDDVMPLVPKAEAFAEKLRCKASIFASEIIAKHQDTLITAAERDWQNPTGIIAMQARFDEAQTIFERFQGKPNIRSIPYRYANQRLREIDEALAKAEKTLSLPAHLPIALSQWSSYQSAIQSSQNQEKEWGLQGDLTNVLDQLVSGEIPAIQIKERIGPVLTEYSEKDWEHLQTWLDAWVDRVGILEGEVLNYLRPDQAYQVINQIRVFLCYLTMQMKEKKALQAFTNQDIDQVIQQSVEAWIALLPAGWPTPWGQSSYYGETDATYDPGVGLYLTPEEFILLLQGRDSEAPSGSKGLNPFYFANTLTKFLTSRQGYYRSFSYITYERDETGHPIKAIRDYDALNQLILVLTAISEVASAQITQQKDLVAINHLKEVKQISDTFQFALREHLKHQYPLESWNWVILDGNQDVVNIVPSRVYSRQAKVQKSSLREIVLTRTRYTLLTAYETPEAYFGELIADRAFTDWVVEEQERGAWFKNPRSLHGVYEEVLTFSDNQNLEEISLIPYSEWLLQSSSAAQTEYLLGRVAERLIHPSSRVHSKRYLEIQGLVQNLSIEEIEIAIDCLHNRQGSFSLPPKVNHLLEKLTPAERLWVAGYMKSRLKATYREIEANQDQIENQEPLFQGDQIVPETMRQEEVDSYLDSLGEEQIADLAYQLMTLYEPERFADDRERALAWYREFDLSKAEALTQRVTLHFNSESVLQTHEARAQFFDQTWEMLGESRALALYAHVWLEFYLFSSRSATEVQELKEKIKESAQQDGVPVSEERFTQLEALLNGRDRNDLLAVFRHNYGHIQDTYTDLCHRWLANGNNKNPRIGKKGLYASSVCRWVYDLINHPEKHPLSDTSEVYVLARELDHQYLAVDLEDPEGKKKIDERMLYVLEAGLKEAKEHLLTGIRQGATDLEPAYQVVQTVYQALFEPFDKEDKEAVKTHSRYNPYGSKLPLAVTPEEILSLTNFKHIWRALDSKPDENFPPLIWESDQIRIKKVLDDILHLVTKSDQQISVIHLEEATFRYQDHELFFTQREREYRITSGLLMIPTDSQEESYPLMENQKALSTLTKLFTRLKGSEKDFNSMTMDQSQVEIQVIKEALEAEHQELSDQKDQAFMETSWKDSQGLQAVFQAFGPVKKALLALKDKRPSSFKVSRSTLAHRLQLVEKSLETGVER